MFDDRLFDTIMDEMMAAFGADVRTDEGSLAYNACCRIAQKLEEVYGDMDDINNNMLPDTQDLDHLIRYAKERGISYEYATAPVVKGVFKQEIDIGEQLVCGDYTYTVTAPIESETYTYKLTCETEGVAANTNLGELTPLDYIDEYLGGEITEIITPGVDDEDEDIFRARVIASFQSAAFGGNRADYRTYIDGLTGVGGCKPKRRTADSPIINIWVISSDYTVPSAELIDEIQSAVDPTVNSGEGDGMAPICHEVKILAVSGVTVDVTTRITFDDGYSAETSQSLIEGVIADYLADLRSTWESNDLEGMIVRVAQIESRILTVEGVLDVESTTLNGTSANLALDYTSVPLLGGVVINV